MSDLKQQAQARGFASAQIVAAPHDDSADSHISVGGHNIPVRAAMGTKHRHIQLKTHNALSSPADILSAAGSYSDFNISTEPLKSLTVRLELKRGAVSTATGTFTNSLVYDLISHIEILTNNGANLIQRIDQLHLHSALMELPRDTYINITKANTFNSFEYATETAYASVPLFIYLFKQPIDAPNSLFTGAGKSPVMVRIWWKTTGTLVGHGFNVKNCTLFNEVYQYDSSVRADYLRKFQMSNHAYRFSNTHVSKLNTPLTYTQRQVVRLSGVNGVILSMKVYVKTGGLYRSISEIELLDENGSSLSGGAALPVQYINTLQRADQSRPDTALTASESFTNWVHFPIGGSDEASGLAVGKLDGYHVMSSLHQLAVTVPIPAGFDADTDTMTNDAEIGIVFETMSTLHVNRGEYTLTLS